MSGDGALLATITPGGVQHFHLDHPGTSTLVTDASGNTLVYQSYLPFGEEATDPDDATIPLQYTGHERDDLDPGAGNTLGDLDYMHRRYFSPHLGRFLSTDPLAGHSLTPQAFNLCSGPWSGDFLTVSGAVTPVALGGFGSPSDQATAESIGWHGVQSGFSIGPPGLGVTTTRYSKLVDLSFLIPWCQ